MFDRIATVVSRHWLAIVLIWAVVIGAAHFLAPDWASVAQDGDFAHLPARATSVRGEKLLAEAFPEQASRSGVLLVIARADGPLTTPDYRVADRWLAMANAMNDPQAVSEVSSYRSEVFGRRLLSNAGPHGQAAFIKMALRREFMADDNIPLVQSLFAQAAQLRQAVDFPAGLELGVTGSAALGADMAAATNQSVRSTETWTVVLVVLILLIVYRAPGLIIVPLLTTTAAVVLSKDVVALLALLGQRVTWFPFTIFRTSQIFITVILFGAGTDFCLFLIARYREALAHRMEPHEAIAYSLGRVGQALTGSALTAILGLATMVFADFGKYHNSGPILALCLAIALIASLTLAPALLRAIGPRVFWPSIITGQDRPGRVSGPVLEYGQAGKSATVDDALVGGFWDRFAGLILARPGLLLIVSLIALAPLVTHGTRVEINYDLVSELSRDCLSVQGLRLAERYADVGETGPITVLARRPDRSFEGAEGRAQIARLTRCLCDLRILQPDGTQLPPVVSVRSRAEPLGNRPGSFSPFSAAGREKLALLNHSRVRTMYVSSSGPLAGAVTRLDLVLSYDPFSRQSMAHFDRLEEELRGLARGEPSSELRSVYPDGCCGEWLGTEFEFTGTTPAIRDLKTVTLADKRLIECLVVLAVLGVLLVLLGRPVVCLYLIFSVLMSYFVTIGGVDLLFSWLYGPEFHGLDWKVPIYLFLLLIALGQDYNIYLVTRVFEEQGRLGPRAGLRQAIVQTGGIITSCGVIMSGTFISMATGTLRGMVELGLALSLGILLDTLVVRTVLVPAFLALWQGREATGSALRRPRANDRRYRVFSFRVSADGHGEVVGQSDRPANGKAHVDEDRDARPVA